jgi:hypothetical protein
MIPQLFRMAQNANTGTETRVSICQVENNPERDTKPKSDQTPEVPAGELNDQAA